MSGEVNQELTEPGNIEGEYLPDLVRYTIQLIGMLDCQRHLLFAAS